MNAALWFFDNGIRLFPIVFRDKVPTVKWREHTCTRHEAANFQNYGVALGALAVIDTDNLQAETWAAANLPDTPFKVKSAQGLHRYYKLVGKAPCFIHRDGNTIEFRNEGQYVVGPGSTHKTGIIYTAEDWSWNIDDIPFFPVNDIIWDDRPLAEQGSIDGNPYKLPPMVCKGERHRQLFILMRSLQARGVPLEGLIDACQAENLLKFDPPIDESEVDKFIRRVSRHPDRKGFNRTQQSGIGLVGSLLDVGVSVNSALVAARSITPDFDPNEVEDVPETPAPDIELEVLEQDWSNLEVLDADDIEEIIE